VAHTGGRYLFFWRPFYDLGHVVGVGDHRDVLDSISHCGRALARRNWRPNLTRGVDGPVLAATRYQPAAGGGKNFQAGTPITSPNADAAAAAGRRHALP